MSLRRFSFILLAAVFVVVFAGLFIVARHFLLGSYEELEREFALRNLDRGRRALESQAGALAAIAQDRAVRDMTYDYMQTSDSALEGASVNLEALQGFDLACILLYDLQGRLAAGWAVNEDGSAHGPVPPELAALEPDSPFMALPPGEDEAWGLARISGGYLLLAGHVVMPGDSQGEPRGVLLLGRPLGPELLQAMSLSVGERLAILDVRSGVGERLLAKHPGLAAESMPGVALPGDGTATAFGLMRDLAGEPLFLLSVSAGQDIHAQGSSVLKYLFLTMLLPGLALFLVMGWLVDRRILGRISELGRQSALLGEAGGESLTLSVGGRDEIAGLASDFNRLLAALRRNREELERRVGERTAELSEANRRLAKEIEERKAVEEEILDRQQYSKTVFDNVQTGILLIDVETREIVDANPLAARIAKRSRGEMLGKRCHECLCAAQEGECPIIDLGQGGDDSERTLVRADGEVIPIRKSVARVRIMDREYLLESFIDISRRKEAEWALETERQFFLQLFEKSPLAIAVLDTAGEVASANSGFENLFGYRAEEVAGRRLSDFIVPKTLLQEAEAHRAAVLEGRTVQKDTKRKHRNGYPIPVSVLAYPVVVQDEVQGLFFSYRDISEQVLYEAQLTHKAFYDELTGLPNRSLFFDRLRRATLRAQRRNRDYFMVMVLDLDRFKEVNDSLGHQVGDMLLSETALRLASCVRESDTVARLGGDEFGVILEECRTPEEVLGILGRIQNDLRLPFTIQDSIIHTSASIGVVMHTRTYSLPEDILRDADIAMYKAKQRGDDYQVFNRSMFERIRAARTMEADLRLAVERNELLLHYQPIVSVASGAITGFETLLRWNHPGEGVIPPQHFIPVAEKTGLIIPIGKWVVREACRQIRKWEEAGDFGLNGLCLSVNISGKQFRQPDLAESIDATIREFGLSPKRLKLEITETVAMDDVGRTRKILGQFKDIGMAVMIDDFGTGYSSLSYLQQFPIDYLKIDRAFVSGSHMGGENQEIVRAIIALARSLGLRVVAEGVETEQQLATLRALDCDEVQGYMFSRPVPVSEAEELFRLSCSR